MEGRVRDGSWQLSSEQLCPHRGAELEPARVQHNMRSPRPSGAGPHRLRVRLRRRSGERLRGGGQAEGTIEEQVGAAGDQCKQTGGAKPPLPAARISTCSCILQPTGRQACNAIRTIRCTAHPAPPAAHGGGAAARGARRPAAIVAGAVGQGRVWRNMGPKGEQVPWQPGQDRMAPERNCCLPVLAQLHAFPGQGACIGGQGAAACTPRRQLLCAPAAALAPLHGPAAAAPPVPTVTVVVAPAVRCKAQQSTL